MRPSRRGEAEMRDKANRLVKKYDGKVTRSTEGKIIASKGTRRTGWRIKHQPLSQPRINFWRIADLGRATGFNTRSRCRRLAFYIRSRCVRWASRVTSKLSCKYWASRAHTHTGQRYLPLTHSRVLAARGQLQVPLLRYLEMMYTHSRAQHVNRGLHAVYARAPTNRSLEEIILTITEKGEERSSARSR